MRIRCPNPACNVLVFRPNSTYPDDPRVRPVIRKGSFYRLRDRRFISRYFCKSCSKHFSSSTLHEDYRQKKRDLNPKVTELACSGVSQRRMALLLRVNPKTIVRKFRLMAERARFEHSEWLKTRVDASLSSLQFDDLETHEHSKCKPLSVSLAVSKKSREIMSFQVSRMPAKGPLAKIAHKKYGKRPDERNKGWNKLFHDLTPILHPEAVIESDENPHYLKLVKQYFPRAQHVRYPGERGAITGQGELKKVVFDPLFSLNHTCAMLRANLNRLFRRTWCTTKTVQGLIDHLSLYVRYHNEVILRP